MHVAETQGLKGGGEIVCHANSLHPATLTLTTHGIGHLYIKALYRLVCKNKFRLVKRASYDSRVTAV